MRRSRGRAEGPARLAGVRVLRLSPRVRRGAFTLIEFIVVMALLATLMALVAPRLSGSLQRRNLDQEARRWIALTEFGRDQAVSQGVPMVVWLDAETSWFGLQPKPGYWASSNRVVEVQLPEEIEFELATAARATGPQTVVEPAPDGYLDADSIEVLGLRHRSGDRVIVTLMTNGWGYETVTEQEYAIRERQPRP